EIHRGGDGKDSVLLNLLQSLVQDITVLVYVGVGINEHKIYLTLKRPNEKPKAQRRWVFSCHLPSGSPKIPAAQFGLKRRVHQIASDPKLKIHYVLDTVRPTFQVSRF